MQNGKATLEHNLVVSYKTKYTFIHEPIMLLGDLPEENENLQFLPFLKPHKKLYLDAIHIFIHVCQSLEAIKMSLEK